MDDYKVTFYPQSDKPIKALIRHLLINISSQAINIDFPELDYDVISVKQITTQMPLT
jgi:hypothetical protein